MQLVFGFFPVGVSFLLCRGPKWGLSTPTGDGQECCKPFLSPFDFFVLMFRRMKPNVRLALAVILSMWVFQDRTSEISTPSTLHL